MHHGAGANLCGALSRPSHPQLVPPAASPQEQLLAAPVPHLPGSLTQQMLVLKPPVKRAAPKLHLPCPLSTGLGIQAAQKRSCAIVCFSPASACPAHWKNHGAAANFISRPIKRFINL